MRGRVENADDVDVFSFTACSGQTLVAEVAAARHGSALDSLLTLYDARGNVLTATTTRRPTPTPTPRDDDADRKDPVKLQAARARRDSVLKFRCPSDGTYYLSLLDANGGGGSAHVYQLSVRLVEAGASASPCLLRLPSLQCFP